MTTADSRDTRGNRISHSDGLFYLAPSPNGAKITTRDSHTPTLTIDKVKQTPCFRPIRHGSGNSLTRKVLIVAFGGHRFLASSEGGWIPGHIAIDALWRPTPSMIWYWFLTSVMTPNMNSSDKSNLAIPFGKYNSGSKNGDDVFVAMNNRHLRSLNFPPLGFLRVDHAANLWATKWDRLRESISPNQAESRTLEGDTDTEPSLERWYRRPDHDTPTCPTQESMMAELIAMRPYRRNIDCAVAAARIGKLQRSISQYRIDESVRGRSLRRRTSGRSFRSEPRLADLAYNWDIRRANGLSSVGGNLDIFRMILVEGAPLPELIAPGWTWHLLDIEIITPRCDAGDPLDFYGNFVGGGCV